MIFTRAFKGAGRQPRPFSSSLGLARARMDLSCLPTVPPALPAWASAEDMPTARTRLDVRAG